MGMNRETFLGRGSVQWYKWRHMVIYNDIWIYMICLSIYIYIYIYIYTHTITVLQMYGIDAVWLGWIGFNCPMKAGFGEYHGYRILWNICGDIMLSCGHFVECGPKSVVHPLKWWRSNKLEPWGTCNNQIWGYPYSFQMFSEKKLCKESMSSHRVS